MRHPKIKNGRYGGREGGSALLEGTIVIFILAMVFLGLFRLGQNALHHQNVQADVDNRAWSKALKTDPRSHTPEVKRDLFGWRANDPATKKKSFRIDVADGL